MQNEQKLQEIRSFVGRNGIGYEPTEEEKKYFDGSLYIDGEIDLSLLSYILAPIH